MPAFYANLKTCNAMAAKALASDYVFESQKRHQPLSNMSMLMLLRRMKIDGVTVHGFRFVFRDWASEAARAA